MVVTMHATERIMFITFHSGHTILSLQLGNGHQKTADGFKNTGRADGFSHYESQSFSAPEPRL